MASELVRRSARVMTLMTHLKFYMRRIREGAVVVKADVARQIEDALVAADFEICGILADYQNQLAELQLERGRDREAMERALDVYRDLAARRRERLRQLEATAGTEGRDQGQPADFTSPVYQPDQPTEFLDDMAGPAAGAAFGNVVRFTPKGDRR